MVRIKELTATTTPEQTDVIAIEDLTNDETKKVSLNNLGFQTLLEGGDKLYLNNPSTDTYLIYDNNRVELWVNGSKKAQWG